MKKFCSVNAFRIAVVIILALLLVCGAGAATIAVKASGGGDYTKIQDAIDNASAGDTILVYRGIYSENVKITKQLTLRGIGNPVVDARGSGSAITLSANGITLEGFTVSGGSGYWDSPEAGINVISSNNQIIGNNASNNWNSGIYLSSSSNNMLSENKALNNWNGIYLGSSSSNVLRGNKASNNYVGIHLSNSNNNMLSGNTANSNNWEGIYLRSSSSNVLSGNRASNNRVKGIMLYMSSNNNMLKENKVSNNWNSGIYLGSSSINNIIYNNIFNNKDNFFIYNSTINTWNTTRQSGTNIIENSLLGGNVWSNPNGKGFSQTCSDVNKDGICDKSYILDANNIDYLPLSINFMKDKMPLKISFTNPTPANGAILVQNYTHIKTTVSHASTAFIDWNRSLVGWWRFNSERGENTTFFKDWSSWRNNATCSGTNCPASTSGKFGKALDFDGVNDYVDAGNGSSLNITGNLTVETWIKPERLETAYIVKKATRDSTDGYELSLSKATGKAYFRVNQKTSGNTYKLFGTSKYPLDGNTWVHLVGVYNKDQVQIYFNGNLENSMSGPINILSNTDKLKIGGPDDSRYFKGTIDEVRIWNRALNAEEIKASYDAGRYRLYRNFTHLANGVYNYRAYAQNLQGNVKQTIKRTLALFDEIRVPPRLAHKVLIRQ